MTHKTTKFIASGGGGEQASMQARMLECEFQFLKRNLKRQYLNIQESSPSRSCVLRPLQPVPPTSQCCAAFHQWLVILEQWVSITGL